MVTRWALLDGQTCVAIILWDGNTDTYNPAPYQAVPYDPAVHVVAVDPKTVNKATLEDRALQALTTNATDVTQDGNIINQANNLAGTTGTRTTAQLSGDVRALAQAVSTLAQNDTNSKKELNALIRLLLNQLDSTTGT